MAGELPGVHDPSEFIIAAASVVTRFAGSEGRLRIAQAIG